MQLELKRLDWCLSKIFEQNAKKHDLGLIILSIEKHGFRDPVAYDSTLDAIIDGNGRIESLGLMFKADPTRNPDGIGLDKDNHWLVPVVIGQDAKSIQQAIAYLIDVNNSVLAGGELTALDISRTWERDGYLELLQMSMPETLTVDESDYSLIANMLIDAEGMFEEEEEKATGDNLTMRIRFDNLVDKEEAERLLAMGAKDEGLPPSQYLLQLLQ